MTVGTYAHTIAVYASATTDSGDDWAKVMSGIGTLLAKAKVRIVCLAEEGMLCRPLITSARAAGGTVLLVSDTPLSDASIPDGALVETIEDVDVRRQRMSDLVDAFIGLPCSLRAIQSLYASWVLAGAGSSGKPVALLNRNRAFEVFRGYANDVLSPGLINSENMMLFSENFDELWGKLKKTIEESE